MVITLVPIANLRRDPKNIRNDAAADRQSELIASLRIHGIKVPLIGYVVADGVMVCDGHRRLDVSPEVGITELPVVILSQKPSETELVLLQLTINGQREELNPVDEFEAFSRLIQLEGWSATELAQHLAKSNADVTRVMAIGKLSLEERQLVREGKISKSAAYALSRMSPDQRSAMARQAAAGEATRDQLNSQVRRRKAGDDVKVKARRVICEVASGTISVQSKAGLTFTSFIELLEGLLRECRKLRTKGLDLSTAALVLKDQCRHGRAGESSA